MRWLVPVCLLAIGLGCSRTHEELVEVPGQQEEWLTPSDLAAMEGDGAVRGADLPALLTPSPQPQSAVGSANGSAAVVPESAVVERPVIIELTKQQTEQQVEDDVRSAQRMIRAGDLATASVLLEEARRLDPASKSAASLQRRLKRAQREAHEKARRALVSLYQREGKAILEGGDVARSLVYFHAAQDLDPTNRKILKRIQGAHARWDTDRAKQREQQFEERLRLAKADTEGEDLVALVAALVETPVEPVMTPVQESVGGEAEAQPETPAAQEVLAVPAAPAIQEGAPATVTGYTIQPEDILEITVYEEPDLTTKTRVMSSGEITVPLLGRVAVMGLTVAQVQEKLTTQLAADYLVNPQVQVFIETYHARNVFVTGSVNKPGSYPIPTERPTTLMEAIAMAGGFSEEASPNRTRIVRIEGGQEKMIAVKVDNIIKKGDKTEDVAVRPNDIIFVPESFF